MKVLSIAALVVVCAVVATALPVAQKLDNTQALIQSLGREESYKLALIQTISELLEQKEQEEQAEMQGGLIWGNKGDEGPSEIQENIEAQEDKEEMSMQDVLELIGKLQKEKQAMEQDDSEMDRAEEEDTYEEEKQQLKDAEVQTPNKTSIQSILEMLSQLEKDNEAENQWDVDMDELKEDKAENQGGIETQENDKMTVENLLEMMGKAEKHVDLDENQEAEEQTDSTAPDKGAVLQSLSEKLDELQVTLQSINDIVRNQIVKREAQRRGGK